MQVRPSWGMLQPVPGRKNLHLVAGEAVLGWVSLHRVGEGCVAGHRAAAGRRTGCPPRGAQRWRICSIRNAREMDRRAFGSVVNGPSIRSSFVIR